MLDGFQEFMTHLSSQLPETFSLEDERAEDSSTLRAAYLWSLLQMIHEDLNKLCRRNPCGLLGVHSIEAINRSFEEVQRLLRDNRETGYLAKLDVARQPTHADALVAVSSYKCALRAFRIESLREDPYSF